MPKSRTTKIPLRVRLAWRSTLLRAYSEVTNGANPDSAGPDGITIESFRRSFKSQIAQLQYEIKFASYVPSPGRGVAISKKASERQTLANTRPITVFNVRDRIVQRAISNLIWPHLRDHVFSDVSFGGIRSYSVRRGANRSSSNVRKNVAAAARRIMELRSSGFVFTFETDIQRFFPSINKSLLLQQLGNALPDRSLDDLLEAAISTAISNAADIEARGLSECWDPRTGVPQGGVLSPLLANFYLAPFDRAMDAAGFQLVRYVDDLVIPTKSQDESERAFQLCKTTLSAMGLTVHELNEKDEKGRVKTRVVGANKSFDFLGLRFNKCTLHPTQDKVDDLRDRIRKITHARLGGVTLLAVIEGLNRLLRGWMAAYSFCDISKGLQTEIDHAAGTGLSSWMTAHKLLRNLNALTLENRRRIGLWSTLDQEIDPLSRHINDLKSR